MRAHLRTRSARLLSCLAFAFVFPAAAAAAALHLCPPFVLTSSMQWIFTADIHSNASIEPQMTRNPQLHCMLLHANICASYI